MLEGRKILLIITGGIAAFKAIDVMRLIRKAGGEVQPLMTAAAQNFVTPMTASTVSGKPTLTELFDLSREAEINHIELVRDADLIVVAPATGNFMAKMAHGIADDLASTAILARDKDVIVVPAMNVRMWESAATQRNYRQLLADGMQFLGPVEGSMACGEFGPGRLAEPPEIFDAICAYFDKGQSLKGKHFIVTSGGTREPIDPVRFISNASSGKQGTAIAQSLLDRGAKVSFIYGASDVPPPVGANAITIGSAQDMYDAVHQALPADGAIFCAAVADWRPAQAGAEKIKKTPGETAAPSIQMVLNPDILKSVAQLDAATRPQLVVGFAAETEKLVEHARAKRQRKGCDWLLANDVSPEMGTFGGDQNKIIFFRSDEPQEWDKMSKKGVAEKLADLIAKEFKGA
ncbi:phosphopantothenoylcysteine decarboxylase/phosphopantothenate--cysteine ligase [Maritalea mobilis]|uniref:Coenzyme A biosynthesis bifunctional protein CoaBC n=1 Tax=Maritalea mobilis TaxID=483324 RepID=A0A4R6VQJ1_9HYPH|nr:bifunctional phosphopantothenoylcysteine decarboxylase/phosphopantothenate--cysteine ligase CoaBC [Maritalea mobilis]TDQ61907.1 phosphopantothenoylcysteine decarboxylase/phosphopantothenate--cysteine ligase [Maritalea mobilis]